MNFNNRPLLVWKEKTSSKEMMSYLDAVSHANKPWDATRERQSCGYDLAPSCDSFLQTLEDTAYCAMQLVGKEHSQRLLFKYTDPIVEGLFTRNHASNVKACAAGPHILGLRPNRSC